MHQHHSGKYIFCSHKSVFICMVNRVRFDHTTTKCYADVHLDYLNIIGLKGSLHNIRNIIFTIYLN